MKQLLIISMMLFLVSCGEIDGDTVPTPPADNNPEVVVDQQPIEVVLPTDTSPKEIIVDEPPIEVTPPIESSPPTEPAHPPIIVDLDVALDLTDAGCKCYPVYKKKKHKKMYTGKYRCKRGE
jgi:hypothetical protein